MLRVKHLRRSVEYVEIILLDPDYPAEICISSIPELNGNRAASPGEPERELRGINVTVDP